MNTTDTAVTLGPHPIFDALLAAEPEESYLRSLHGLGHRDALYPALEPDAVLDPTPPTTIHARLISATPTGSIRLDLLTRSVRR